MWLNSLVSALFIAAHLIGALEVGDNCRPSAELSEGKCTLLSDCEAAVRELKINNRQPFKRCGFKDEQEVMCCPPAPSNKLGGLSRAARECQKIMANENVVPPRTFNIIGGEIAAIGEFPHMVALGFLWDEGYRFNCGGTLISDRYVVTAGHCIDNVERIEPTIARLGVVDVSDKNFNSQYDINIEAIVRHPQYKRREKYYDIALIRLANSVQWDSTKYPACLYTEQEAPRIPLTVTGWGVTNTTTLEQSNLLLKANLMLVPMEKCRQVYGTAPRLTQGITDDQICAVDPKGIRDTCQGDSGGPLQGQTSADDSLYRLVGITSFGKNCGSGVPGVYTRLTSYLDWIESVVWPN